MDSKLSMAASTVDVVQTYYDERVEGKIRDFTHPNPRIEAAIQTLADWAPSNPKRILEIGCGIGATSWRMARAWPQAEVIGADVSPAAIEVAKHCFQRQNLTYRTGLIKEGVLEGKFDLILLMDVYEHIALDDRASIHLTIKSLLSEESRIVITVPTPATQEYARIHDPSRLLQPVDEDINIDDIKNLAEETVTDLLYYRKVGIWRYGDYAHLVFGRFETLADVALREYTFGGIAGLKRRLKGLIGICQTQSAGRRDYLGCDFLRPSTRDLRRRFNVSARERKRLAPSWFKWNSGKLPPEVASSWIKPKL